MAKLPSNDPASSIQPDTIPIPGEAGHRAIELLDRHRNVVITVTVVAALGICGALIVRELNRQKRSEAAQALSQAAAERSIEKLDAVIADYGGSVAAGNAMITKAGIQLSQEKFEDARITLLTFVDKFRDHPRHAQGLYALGNLSHKNGDFKAATDFYDRALADAPAGDLGPLILIRKGDIALAQADALRAEGKKEEADAKRDEARQHYDDAITRPEFRSGPFIDLAEQRLELANVGNIPVVPAPPKPEPKEEPKPAGKGKPKAASAPTTVPDGKTNAPAKAAEKESGKTKAKAPAKSKTDSPPKPKSKAPAKPKAHATPDAGGKAKAKTAPKTKGNAEGN